MSGGTVFNINRFAIHDGTGIRTTIFLKGCPMKCVWCHNPEGMVSGRQVWHVAKKCINCSTCLGVCSTGALSMDKGKILFDPDRCSAGGECTAVCPTGAMKWDSKYMTLSDVMEIIKRDIIAYEESDGGVTISGGEPTFEQREFALDILRECRKEGVRTAIESCMFTSWEVVESFIDIVDEFIVDLKIFDSERHLKATGVSNLPILENIKRLSEKKPILVRTPMIPGYTDDLENVRQIAAFVSTLSQAKMELLNFNPLYSVKYKYRSNLKGLENEEKLSKSQMQERRDIVLKEGVICI